MKRSPSWNATVLVLMLGLTGCGGGPTGASGNPPSGGGTPPPAPATAAVRVDASGAGNPLTVALGSQLDGYTFAASLPGMATHLQALAPSVFRIHAGSDLGVAVLPEPAAVGSTAQYDFRELDNLVSLAYGVGATPVLNVRYAPRALWTCSNFFSGQTGTLADTTYGAFAAYMARLVSYYNLGVMTDGGITRINPVGTTHRITYWEIWNEPDLSNETPCAAPAGAPALSSSQYLSMWNTVTQTMLALDPTLKFVGPATSNATTGQNPEYVPALLSAANAPAAVSFHAYGGTHTMTDSVLFNGDGSGTVGVPGVLSGMTQVLNWAKSSGRPVWLDETNLEFDFGDDPTARPWTAFGAAFDAAGFERIATLTASGGGSAVIVPFEYAESGFEQSQLDPKTGTPLLNYWLYRELGSCFPAGARLLPLTIGDAALEALAARKADGSVCVMVINAQPAASGDVGGKGVGRSPTVVVAGLQNIRSVSLDLLDNTTPLASGPQSLAQPLGASATVAFAGYGVAFVRFSP